jgi:CRP/FNR family transcriptional regulator, cyclic AMP receptor protein
MRGSAQVKMSCIDVKDLQRFKNLARFSPEQLEKLARHCSVRTLEKSEIIFDQDEHARWVYLLLSGVVSVSHININERQTVVSLLSAGEFFGLESLVPQRRHPFRCEAFGDCSLGLIKPQSFIEILLGIAYETFLPWCVAAFDTGHGRYIHCIKGIGLDLRKRIAVELLDLADRFGATEPEGILIGLNLSHELLANIVGGSRQQVTEYLNEFDRAEMISRQGRRIIVDADKLRKVLENA